MNPFLKKIFPGLLGIGSLFAAAPALADPSVMEYPALADEDLLGALKRIHPCLSTGKDTIPNEVFFMNPERANARGQMVLTNRRIRLPASFSSSPEQCGGAPRKTDADAAEAFPSMMPSTTPSAEKPVTAHHEKEVPREELTVSPFFSLTKLSANVYSNSSQPTLTSKILPGVEIEYERELSPKWSLALTYRYTGTAYQEQEGLEFTEPSTNQSELAAQFTHEAAPGTRISLSAGAAQIDDMSINDESKLVIDHTWRPTLGFAVQKELFNSSGYELSGTLGGQLFVPVGAQQSFGLAEFARLNVERHFFHHLILGLNVATSTERQATQNETHSLWSTSFGFTVGYRF